MRVKRFVQASLVFGVVSFLAACGGTGEPAASDQPAARQAPAPAEVVQHMHDHLAQVQQVQHAIIRGDLEAATGAADTFAKHQELSGLPDTVRSTIDQMQKAATEVSSATTLDAAGDAAGRMVAQCGACHSSMGAKPSLPAPPAAQGGAAKPIVAKMIQHQHAVDLLYQGLVVPSDEMWKRGAEALKESPLKADAFPVDAQLSKEALDAQSRTHEVAEKAMSAATPTARAEIYGDLIGGCASCHSLSGRVLGPGVPK
jgi:mono/diheme cytochrome c family protein